MADFFLRYVAERLMGEPIYDSGGTLKYVCPVCDSPRAFAVLAHKPQYKDRFKCLRCGAWGDELDLLEIFEPEKTNAERLTTLREWRKEWKAGVKPVVDRPRNFLRGAGAVAVGEGSREEFGPEANAAYTDFAESLCEAFAMDRQGIADLLDVGQLAVRIGMAYGVEPSTWAERLQAMSYWARQEAVHMAMCNDPECDYRCCRLKRGWTEKEIQEAVEREWALARERRKGR